ncbi:hypothetical protein RhiirA1_542241 [Rhizophagus irregularis]|uniref:F-box domain-containing protein n=2 Tax=Rhizophagus irregularis TaxID=588596 RepID=A0A2N0QYG2_9GLOM|nr:hypothetical protein RhiirA1_542241 [Rhizophagus irregularis]
MTTELNSDCLNLIFDELIYDKKSLHSCLLVNKRWCNVVVPILWKKHAWSDCVKYLREVKMRRVFKTILSFLSSSSRLFLSDNEISIPPIIPETTPTFNYISFCNFPEDEIIKIIMRAIFKRIRSDDKKKILEQEIYKLFISQCKNIREIHLQTTHPLNLFPGASECFSQLYSLRIDMKSVNSEIIHGMAQLCKDLNSLSIYNFSEDNLELISLINSQKKNLKELYIYATNDNVEKLKQCLSNSEFPNLKILGVTGLKCFKELAMLIEKTKGNISRIYVYTTDKWAKDTELLIQAVSKNCPKIKFLRTYIEPKYFINIKSVLLNCKNLEKLRLDNINRPRYDEENTGDELLNILSEFSPDSLINITLSEDWKFSIDTLTRFLESYRVRTLNEFDIIQRNISNITLSHCDIINKYIKEGVIKRSNCTHMKHIRINDSDTSDSDDMFW